MKRKPVSTTMAAAALLVAAFYLIGCDFNPGNYFSRSACDFLNCDVLFFVDDILPLSGGPMAADAGAPADAGGGDEGGGHVH